MYSKKTIKFHNILFLKKGLYMSKNYSTIAFKKETLAKLNKLELELYWVKIDNNSDKVTFLIEFYEKNKDLLK